MVSIEVIGLFDVDFGKRQIPVEALGECSVQFLGITLVLLDRLFSLICNLYFRVKSIMGLRCYTQISSRVLLPQRSS